ncbi:DUF4167 domain-containing protein [Brevundimonas diminuta]|uniref:DUF4167 domain-containing protein n=1 Tax=Brevundimonas diminuta TaxID=293 RepID=UPI0020982287|nr:DUF4167 domain-containing protein [Brevundimonas diminuta]MCO8019814.1 DUF4167 domain-containing protein [Brevundimonas diminuta]MCO8023089.1 DUF4167 domain-containing protein [Brevundimonas diminuta]
MKRQRGRNRKPGGGNNANATNPNRSWDSQGPENIKVRGNAQTVYERYMQLARDAAAAGDRVLAENYTQHAEHYFRVLRALQPQRPVSEIAQRELAGQGFDIDFEDESGAQAAAIIAAQQAEERRLEDEARRQAERAEREANRDRDRDREGSDNGADGEGREGGRRETRRERWERRREERNRRFENNEGEGDAAASGEDSAAGDDQPAESAAAPAVVEEAPVERTPRGPRAPRRARAAVEDDAAQPTDDAAALPGFLTRPITGEEAASAEDEPAPAPKRRTRRKADAVVPDEEG